jgi:hypothetical protein
VLVGASVDDSRESEATASAHRCDAGADPGGRGKPADWAAVSVRRAVNLLDAGDLEGARSVLTALLALL